ncbi:MAG: hypothetical protein V7723_12405 [Sneathiella sp.]|uniref:hypothetical protein n=1 Tax=Sneathiella sp. TaxID=1964365 RepID=UPI003000FEC9
MGNQAESVQCTKMFNNGVTCTQHPNDHDIITFEKIPWWKKFGSVFIGALIIVIVQMVVNGHISGEKLRVMDNIGGMAIGCSLLLLLIFLVSLIAVNVKEASVGKYAMLGIGSMAVIGGVGLELILAKIFG